MDPLEKLLAEANINVALRELMKLGLVEEVVMEDGEIGYRLKER